jgi:arylformamidase
MIASFTFEFEGKQFQADLTQPLDISLPLREGVKNPNCYWADTVEFQTIVAGNFVGSVAKGGSVNYQKLMLTPHGNGTHTECYGHITDTPQATINRCLKRFFFLAELITVQPERQENGDQVITLEAVRQALGNKKAEALVIRTLPNEENKKQQAYSGTNPPYFDAQVMEYLATEGFSHVLTDLPSVDREQDEGRLAAHKAFWQLSGTIREQSTITELIFVANQIQDGTYLLNLQIISLEMDASPSKPVLYAVKQA